MDVKSKTADGVSDNADTTFTASKITLLFVGDLMQHKAQIDAARTGNVYDYSDCFRHVKDEISKADVAIANLEVTLAGKPYRGFPCFSAPDEYLGAVLDAGFDVLLTANNHILDRGQKGLERTNLLLDSFHIPRAGSYKDSLERVEKYPLLIEKEGFRISLLNYTYATNGLIPTAPNIVNYIDKEIIAKDIQAAKAQQPDVIIACMHWGNEYQSLPSREQTKLTDWLFSQGVTHIIGSHPHVVQPLELRTDTLADTKHVVVYSLGNFISNMSKRKTDGGLMFKMELTKDSVVRVGNCEYSLVWTALPKENRKNHTLIPVNYPTDSLSKREQDVMDVFVKDTRSLLEKHNVGIKEYTFY